MTTRGKALLGIAAILFSTLAAGLASAQSNAHSATPDIQAAPDILKPAAQRKDAADFTLPDQNAQPLTLSAYKGKVVLLDFWATWCGGCKVELPWYIEFDRKYGDKGLVVIGVSMDDGGMKVVKPFLAEKHINYRVVLGNDQLAEKFALGPMPMTLLIDRTGKVAVSHSGIVNKESFEENINALLAH